MPSSSRRRNARGEARQLRHLRRRVVQSRRSTARRRCTSRSTPGASPSGEAVRAERALAHRAVRAAGTSRARRAPRRTRAPSPDRPPASRLSYDDPSSAERAPYGHAAMQYLQPMQRSASITTMPSSPLVRRAAPGTPTRTAGFSHCMHGRGSASMRALGYAPVSRSSTTLYVTPGGVRFSALHATVHESHPTHFARSMTMPQCGTGGIFHSGHLRFVGIRTGAARTRECRGAP